MTKSLWARYINEQTLGRVHFIEYDWGFISYSCPPDAPDALLCEDIYVIPEKRDASHALRLHSEAVAAGRAMGKTRSLFVVRADSPNCAYNLRIYLAMGFIPHSMHNGVTVLSRDFKQGD